MTKKYAKIINKETKECNVGIGTNEKFYKSIGMTLQEVEQSYDGSWYLVGYAPQKPQELINQEEIAECQKYLADTDYIVVKISEAMISGNQQLIDELKNKYADVLTNRDNKRKQINEFEEEIKNEQEKTIEQTQEKDIISIEEVDKKANRDVEIKK